MPWKNACDKSSHNCSQSIIPNASVCVASSPCFFTLFCVRALKVYHDCSHNNINPTNTRRPSCG